MIVLYKRGNPIKNIQGQVTGYETQAVYKPNNFFTYIGLKFNWQENTVTWRGEVYYLDKMQLQTGTSQLPTTDEWLSSYGNWIETIFYLSNQKEGNPSGNVDNIYRLIYRNDTNQPKYILEYEYDSRDNVVAMRSMPPDGATAVSEANQYKLIIYNDHSDTKEFSYNRNATIQLFAPDEIPGYRFLYYVDNNEKQHAAGSQLKITSNIELFAVYMELVTFSIVGIEIPIRQQYDKGTIITIDPGIPQKENYNFVNYLCEQTNETFAPGQEITLESNVELVAQWESTLEENQEEE